MWVVPNSLQLEAQRPALKPDEQQILAGTQDPSLELNRAAALLHPPPPPGTLTGPCGTLAGQPWFWLCRVLGSRPSGA